MSKSPLFLYQILVNAVYISKKINFTEKYFSNMIYDNINGGIELLSQAQEYARQKNTIKSHLGNGGIINKNPNRVSR